MAFYRVVLTICCIGILMNTFNVTAQYAVHHQDAMQYPSPDHLSLTALHAENISILHNLGQAYEAEFSKITGKIPDEHGVFHLDTLPQAPYTGYLLYENTTIVGFCIVNIQTNPMDIAEFYIIPSKRKKKLGMYFAYALFGKYPGAWQVRQIQGADHAVTFWRRVIDLYTHGQYQEETIQDPDWGVVTRQTFSSIKNDTMGTQRNSETMRLNNIMQ